LDVREYIIVEEFILIIHRWDAPLEINAILFELLCSKSSTRSRIISKQEEHFTRILQLSMVF